MSKYTIEVTDTFSGEANYCWVRRFVTNAKSPLGAIRKLQREWGGQWRMDYGNSEDARYNLKGACICAFVTWADDEADTSDHKTI